MMKRIGWGLTLLAVAGLSGCVTVAEFRKVERDVLRLKQQPALAEGGARERLAELGVQLDGLEAQVADLDGRFDVLEHQVARALEEAKAARREAAGGAQADAGGANPTAAETGAAAVGTGASAQEVSAYREAYAAWRNNEVEACIDRFRGFLQTYASSSYAENAAYWLADCHFKQGDYKTAILRFDDVVARYPGGDKAADALYRQGESLLRLGPRYGEAASKAFERVVKEYPNSPRAAEAKRQLELLGPG